MSSELHSKLSKMTTEKGKKAYEYVYKEIRKAFPRIKLVLATYFEGITQNLALVNSLPVNVLHLCPLVLAT